MEKVYFKAVDSYPDIDKASNTAQELLRQLVDSENVALEKFVPLKVHFGEKGNKTYIRPENYRGIIDYLSGNNIDSAYIETNALYRGERTSAAMHKKLAAEHGFTELPVIIADGEHGEAYNKVVINKKHFIECKIAKGISEHNQLIVLSHFKGHILAGFGGAIKQLAMGCAARGGKLDQHATSVPRIQYLKCKACKACVAKCPENAIAIGRKAKIDKKACVGCASCIAICPHGAITNNWWASLSRSFSERMAEYAYAAAHGKNNIYITFALNITKNCDCEGHNMKPIVNDLGIFASRDPVAIDKACLDALDHREGRMVFKRGRYILEYAEKIGLGNREYELVEIK